MTEVSSIVENASKHVPWIGSAPVRDTLTTSTGNLRAVQLLLGHTKSRARFDT